MDVTVKLVTGETLVGTIVGEDKEHIILRWKGEKKFSFLAKSIIQELQDRSK